MDPLGHQRTRAWEALRLDLAPQAGLIRAALRQTRAEVRDIRIDLGAPPVATVIGREELAPDPGAHRLGIKATRTGYW